jgi:hypothetical protein
MGDGPPGRTLPLPLSFELTTEVHGDGSGCSRCSPFRRGEGYSGSRTWGQSQTNDKGVRIVVIPHLLLAQGMGQPATVVGNGPPGRTLPLPLSAGARDGAPCGWSARADPTVGARDGAACRRGREWSAGADPTARKGWGTLSPRTARLEGRLTVARTAGRGRRLIRRGSGRRRRHRWS